MPTNPSPKRPINPQATTTGPGGQLVKSDKDWMVTFVLAILVGVLGIDRFYTGSTRLGVLKLVTLGGLGLWWLIDLFLLVAGIYKDENGIPIRPY